MSETTLTTSRGRVIGPTTAAGPVRFVVGWCPTCGAQRYRTAWMDVVRCDHRPGCLTAKRERQGRLK